MALKQFKNKWEFDRWIIKFEEEFYKTPEDMLTKTYTDDVLIDKLRAEGYDLDNLTKNGEGYRIGPYDNNGWIREENADLDYIREHHPDVDVRRTIRSARISAGFSKAYLARYLDIPIRTLEDWEAGRTDPAPWAEKLLLKEIDTMAFERKCHNGVEVDTLGGKTRNIPTISVEQMFDNGIMGAGDQAYVWAIPHDRRDAVRFRLVINIEAHIEHNIMKRFDDGFRFEIKNIDTNRKDFIFYYVTIYEDDDETEDYYERLYLASFLPGSSRDFGYAHFRSLRDIASYIEFVKNARDIEWNDSRGDTCTLKDLRDMSKEYLHKYHSMVLDLEGYNIFDEDGGLIFRR